MSKVQDERELLSKPGDTILETIEFLKMSQVELAERLGKKPSKVNDLISGKESISVKTAIQLEKVLGIDAQFWLNRETLYREKLSRIEQEEFLEECISWLDEQPVKELKKLGYLKAESAARTVDELLQFYGVVSPPQVEALYINEYANVSFRKSSAHQTALGAMAAWLRIGELEFRKLDLPDFNKDNFKAALQTIRGIVEIHPDDFAIQLREICLKAGVALIYSMSFPKAPISGATRWIGNNPVIQLTDRYKTNDHFWFTFFHEAAHILLHGKKDVFIEDFDGADNDEVKEQEADTFAGHTLLTSSFNDSIPGQVTDLAVRKLAREFKTHPAIIVGKLQHLNKVPKYWGNDFKMKVDLNYVIKNKL